MKISRWFRLKDNRGQASAVGEVVALLVMIAIGAMVVYSVIGSIDRETGSYADNAIKNVEEKGVTIFNLLTLLAIVVVAALIIAVVIRAIGGATVAPAPPVVG